MGKAAIDITRLTRDEQLALLDDLWSELGRDPSALPLTEAQREDLDRRLDELEAEGPVGVSWEEAVRQIRSRPK
jgi:putative addiction module component (TIGR02574 family)